MAGTLSVQKIQGLATAADPTTVEISSGHTLVAAGHVVAAYTGQTRVGQEHITWSCSSGNGTQYGSTYSNRTYVQVRSFTITPKTSSSILLCTGMVGWSSGMNVSTGAHGQMITLNDTEAIEHGDYPFYPHNVTLGAGYYPTGPVHGSFTLSSASAVTIRLRAFGYVEGSNTFTARYRGHSFSVLEIAQ
jgi:hypothetical protein